MQRGLQHTHPLLPERLRDASAWEHGVEAVERAGHHVQLTQHAAVLQALRERDVESTLGTYAMHAEPAFQRATVTLAAAMTTSADLAARTLALPLHQGMSQNDLTTVAAALSQAIRSQSPSAS